MQLDRRKFLNLAAAGFAAGFLAPIPPVHATSRRKIKAIAFDAFPIFDPRPVFALAEKLFPGRGIELGNAWRTRQFEYQWLRALSGHYANFWQATEDALVFSCEMLKLDLTTDKRKQLMSGYLELKVWPDVPPALQSLKNDGIQLALLSNATPRILDAGIKNSGLDDVFEHVLSTDEIKTYKPDPRAYHMAIDAFHLKREEILFVPFAGWDAAGAKSFGYTTFWVNRLNLPVEKLGVLPDAIGQNLTDLVNFMKEAR
ncbi:2-haloalkanoic acid dehalogenase [mine drainage metagenome]|uniref:2-haloalkanoic acid dehalogenase n=1 Tax=mine drainage metagenome TaxID=410659 RepID=A0A1J5Q863_9ZZZZ